MLILVFQLVVSAFAPDYFLIQDTKSSKIASIRNKSFVMMDIAITKKLGYPSAFQYHPNQLSINGQNLCRFTLDVLGKSIVVCSPADANTNWELAPLPEDKDLYQIKLVNENNDCEMCLGFSVTPDTEASTLREVSCTNSEYNTIFFLKSISSSSLSTIQQHMGSPANRKLSRTSG